MKTKYILLLLFVIGLFSCDDEQNILPKQVVLPELTTGTVDFSNYVALGASFTAGFTDGALFKASQENSFPNILAKQFAKANGGDFTQPLMNDNYGGIAFGGNRLPGISPRLVFGGAGPVPLERVIGPVTVTTDLALNNPTGPFNNLGVPGAKSFHLLFNGYGNPAGLLNNPVTANPYFVRMATSPNATMLSDAMAQNPTFFTLSEIGGNDVLGYATSGGDGSNPITDTPTFDFAFNTLVTTLTSGGAKGAVTNVPYITDLSHFTTITYDALDPEDDDIGPQLIPQIANLNTQLYKPLDDIFTAYGEPDRVNILSVTKANPLLIHDETATDRSSEITTALTPTLGAALARAFGAIFGKARQATENDLIVLSAGSVIAQPVAGIPAPVNVNGISYPLQDNWVLIPSEQEAIKNATDSYNATIASVVNANPNVVLVDLNSILTQIASSGINFDSFTLKTALVTGGAISLDGVHLTARGYALMANKFLEAIDAKFGSNFIASGNVSRAVNYQTNYSPLLQ